MEKEKERIDRYILEDELGRGGMSAVYLGFDPHIKRNVAVKIITSELARDPVYRARFLREAEIIAQLEHANIVPIYDFGEHENRLYIVMRYMPGGSLKDRIKEKIFSLKETSHIMNRMASALDKAHEHGIVHRDMKPANILFDQENEAYLTDFGIAQIAHPKEDLTGEALIGTPAYMSPEYVGSEAKLDGRSDIYSLGVIMYEMLTRETPYRGETGVKLALKHMQEQIPNILEVNPHLPKNIDGIIKRTLAKEPEDRYATTKEFARAIESIGDELTLPPAGTAELAHGIATTAADAQSKAKKSVLPRPLKYAWFGIGSLVTLGALAVLLGALPNPLALAFSPPTEAATATATQLPTPTTTAERPLTPTVPPTPVLSPMPELAAITLGNSNQLQEIARIGRGTIGQIAISPDQQQLAVAGSLGVWILDLETLQVEVLLEGHTAVVNSIAWSPDSSRIASGSNDGTVRIWELASQQQLIRLAGSGEAVSSVAWSPDGSQLASTGEDNLVRLWDAATGRELRELAQHDSNVNALAYAPSGSMLASAGWNVIVWNIDVGFPLYLFGGHLGPVKSIAWSPGSSMLASASGDGSSRIWNVDGGTLTQTLEGFPAAVDAIAWSGDGASIALASGSQITVREAASGQVNKVIEGNGSSFRDLQWTNDSTTLVSSTRDGAIQLWSATNGVEVAGMREFNDQITTGAVSPDGQFFALATGNNTIHIWDATTGEEISMFSGHLENVNAIDWSPDGRLVASASDDSSVRIWDTGSGEQLQILSGHTARVSDVRWSPDGSRIASGSDDGSVMIWNPESSERLLRLGQKEPVAGIAWSPDGTQVAFGSGSDVWVRDATTTGLTLGVMQGNPDQVLSVAWSPDGSRLISGGLNSRVRIWDVSRASELRALGGNYADVHQVVWSPDGNLWIAGGSDSRIYFWDANSGAPLFNIGGHAAAINSLIFSPDGTSLITASSDGTFRVWGIPIN